MKWCLSDIINIGGIVGLENELPVKATSKIMLNKYNTEKTLTANSKQSQKNSLQEKRIFKRKGEVVLLDRFLVFGKKQNN